MSLSELEIAKAKHDFAEWSLPEQILPICFPNKVEINGAKLQCPKCKDTLPDGFIRMNTVWQSQNCVLLEFVGICETCKTIIRKSSRYRDDLSCDTFHSVSGARTHKLNNESLLSMIFRRLTFRKSRKLKS